MASVKKLHIVLNLAEDLPEYAVGDEKRLMQIILNVVGNGVKFSKEGSISITAFVAKAEYLRDARTPEFFPVPGDTNFYLRVQVFFFFFFIAFLVFIMGGVELLLAGFGQFFKGWLTP